VIIEKNKLLQQKGIRERIKMDKEADRTENMAMKRQSIDDTQINNTGVH
jgi:hypothetical protein